MEENTNYERDLATIRNIMERSAKFISLSGLAGVMAGFYALLASWWAYKTIYHGDISRPRSYFEIGQGVITQIMIVGAVTLLASLITAWFFSYRKAKKQGLVLWNVTSKRLLINMFIPMVAGGAFVLALMWHGFIGHVAPACLIFYGLALVNAGQNLFDEIRYLGYCELILGVIAAFLVGYGLVFWAIGFGVLHIVYGVLMYRKYDA